MMNGLSSISILLFVNYIWYELLQGGYQNIGTKKLGSFSFTIVDAHSSKPVYWSGVFCMHTKSETHYECTSSFLNLAYTQSPQGINDYYQAKVAMAVSLHGKNIKVTMIGHCKSHVVIKCARIILFWRQ